MYTYSSYPTRDSQILHGDSSALPLGRLTFYLRVYLGLREVYKPFVFERVDMYEEPLCPVSVQRRRGWTTTWSRTTDNVLQRLIPTRSVLKSYRRGTSICKAPYSVLRNVSMLCTILAYVGSIISASRRIRLFA